MAAGDPIQGWLQTVVEFVERRANVVLQLPRLFGAELIVRRFRVELGEPGLDPRLALQLRRQGWHLHIHSSSSPRHSSSPRNFSINTIKDVGKHKPLFISLECTTRAVLLLLRCLGAQIWDNTGKT